MRDRAGLESLLRDGVARHPRDPRQARRARPARPARCSSRCPTTPASWPGCSPTPARAASTSRTSASTTTPAATTGLVELRGRGGPGRAPADLPGSQGLGDPPVGSPLVNSAGPRLGNGVVVAVDGTSGSGKSSTSRGVARRLGLRYLDTGAMYRAVTWWMLRHGVDVHDPAAVASRCDEPRIESGTDPSGPDDHRRRPGRRRRDPRGRRQRRGVPGEHRAAGPRPDAGHAARRSSRTPWTAAASSSRAATSAPWSGRTPPVKVYLSADAAARAAAPGRRGGWQRPGGHPRVAPGPRRDRLGPRRRRRWSSPRAPSTSTPPTSPWTRPSTRIVAMVESVRTG